ncbi:OmpA family protein [Mucilaginibacter sp. Bleaf8]|uniref:OmpA family protein n=1 Tax=Mucilaginibacter sp. Bleaf8 TaxID=2834430 RepID=UPI001BCA88A8|nr:OmpA family protein [Mucilaginibacter sp. Bleaf8]MBS7564429.1 OmpA family protein [Mucilaginibacter sp. Bleaf8]
MKKLYTKLILFLLLVLPGLSSRAQYIVKQADQQYDIFNYSKAVELYLKAYKKDSTLHNAERLANSYRFMHDYLNAEKWFAITTAKTGSKTENVLRYAEALKNNLKYAEAKAQYTKYYTLSRPIDTARLNFWTSACDSAMRWMKNPVPVTLKNEASLNSNQSDWGTVIYNNQILFTSDRSAKDKEAVTKKNKPFLRFDYRNEGPNKDIYGWTGRSYLKLYSVPQNAATTDAIQLFELPARADYHVGPPSFTADGTEMCFTMTRIPERWEGRKDSVKTVNIEVYTSKKNPISQRWEKPVPFKYNNVQYWSVGDPFITPDGKTLYFVSDMTGTTGGTDIWYCNRGVDGDWAKPVNFRVLNTTGNERTPVMSTDSIFYFSSDGAKGMGGLDVFRAVPRINGYQKQNMGYPFNSPQDDFAFLLSSNTTGYLSSNRQGGAGSDDIYSFVYQPAPTYLLTGVVFNKSTRQRIPNSTVTLTPVKGRDLKAQSDANGAYKFTLQSNSEYRLKGAKEGYLSDNDDRPISTAGLPPTQEIRKNLYLEKIVLKKAIRLENIYYDLDKADIRPDAAIELDKLIKILKDNPTIEVELGSHTDSRGDDDYNKELSERRANAAVDYITTVGGIDEYRIIARGYGESRLLNRCGNGVKCSETDHQLNRRTEFTIIKY